MLRSAFRRLFPRTTSPVRRPRPTFRPQIELMEGRLTPATISGQVWYGVDGDGVHDAGETGRPGANPGVSAYSVELLDGTGTPIDGMNLTSGGTYSFAGVADGSYGVRFNRLTGPYRFSTPGTDSNSVTGGVVVSGGADETLDAGVVGIGRTEGGEASVSGVAYLDADGDGVKDAGEVGLSGVGVSLRRYDGGNWTEIATATTGTGGAYSFDSLWADTYAAVFSTVTGYAVDTPATGGQSAVLGPTTQGTVNAGLVPFVTVTGATDTTEGSATPGAFHLSRSGNTALSLTVNYTLGGAAVAGPTTSR